MVHCPNCKSDIDLPFEVNKCPECGYDFNSSIGNESETTVINPFYNSNISTIKFEKGMHFLNKYEVGDFIKDRDIFSYYHINDGDENLILQVTLFDKRFSSKIYNDLDSYFAKYPFTPEIFTTLKQYGLEDTYIYFIYEYFPFNTLESVVNSSEQLSVEMIIHLFLSLLDYYENSLKNDPHLFINPNNILFLGNNQFKILNYKIYKFFGNMFKPSQFFNNSILPFLAPEIISGDKIVTIKSDLYSIGKVWDYILNHKSFYRTTDTNIKIKDSLKFDISKMLSTKEDERSINIENLKNKLFDLLEKISDEGEKEDIIIDDVEVLDDEEFIEIEPLDITSPPPIKNLTTTDEIEVDMIMKKVEPPQLNTSPPQLKDKNITDEMFKKSRSALLKDPLNATLLKKVYSYYTSRDLFDEAYVISLILNFLNDLSDSAFIFKQAKKIDWDIKNYKVDDNLWFKLIPKKFYLNTSGMMIYLKNFLELSKTTIPPVVGGHHSTENLDYSDEKGKQVEAIIKFLDLKDLKIKLTSQDIGGNSEIFCQIYKRDSKIIVLLKKQIYQSLDSKVFTVILSKFLSLAHPDLVNNFLYQGSVIEELFYGVLKYLVPSARSMHNTKVSNMVFKGMQDFKEKGKLKHLDIVKLVILINEHLYSRKPKPDINASLKNLEIASDRIALILSNDLNATLKMFRDFGTLKINLSAKERVKELLKFVLSDNYFKIRKMLKQNIF